MHDELGGAPHRSQDGCDPLRRQAEAHNHDAVLARRRMLSCSTAPSKTVRRIATDLRPACSDDFGLVRPSNGIQYFRLAPALSAVSNTVLKSAGCR